MDLEVQKRLKFWTDAINETNLCKHQKQRAINYLTTKFHDNLTIKEMNSHDEYGYSLGKNKFINLFDWSKTTEKSQLWVNVNNKLIEIGKTKYYE